MTGFFSNLRAFFGGGQQPPENQPPEGDYIDDWMHSATWLHTASSNVEAIRYLFDEQILEVEFKNGGFYQYYAVPPETAKAMYLTDSPGRFVWRHLRDIFDYAKLTSISTIQRRGPTVVRPRNDITDSSHIPLGDVPDWQRH